MAAANMTAWTAQVVERFRALLNVSKVCDETDDEGVGGDDDAAKLQRVAIARNRNPEDVRAAHETLAALAFSGYLDWFEYDDDEWTKNCLSQVLADEQSRFLVSVLEGAGLVDLTTAVQLMAGPYRTAWQQAAESEAAQSDATVSAAGLIPAENAESWSYSRTPGTRYYIFHGGQYLYSDDQAAALAGWATAEVRDNQAASRSVEWETGSGVYYTAYDNPAHVSGVTHVFGQSKDGPWTLTRAQAEQLLAASRQSLAPGAAVAVGSPIEPYFDTGYFTKYDNGTYFFGEAADTNTWYPSYQELLDAIAVPDPIEAVSLPLDGTADPLEEIFANVPGAIAMSLEDLFEAIQEGLSRAEPG